MQANFLQKLKIKIEIAKIVSAFQVFITLFKMSFFQFRFAFNFPKNNFHEQSVFKCNFHKAYLVDFIEECFLPKILICFHSQLSHIQLFENQQ